MRIKNKKLKGFTIVEMLVVLSIMTLLTSSLIFYNRAIERQIILTQEQIKSVGVLNRAKSLAIGAFGESGSPCSYGVNFKKPATIILFRDLPPQGKTDCASSDNIYSLSNPNEFIQSFTLDQSIEISAADFSDIVFIPPDPTVKIDDQSDKSAGTITFQIKNTANRRYTKVNSAGQITAPDRVPAQ